MSGVPLPFSGKVAVVTGAAGNIGLATATRLARQGADLALLDVDAAKLEQARATLLEHEVRINIHACDVTDNEQVRQTVETVVAELGQIDFLFNNAGYQGAFAPVQDYPEADFARVMQINVVGAFHVLRHVSAHMVARKFGRIVNTASMAGVQGPPNMAAYGASKFAIIGLTEVAAKDLAPYNIRVNAISPAFMGPGFMWDRQVELQAKAGSQYFSTDPKEVARQMIGSIPMRRYGNINEIPGVVAFLFSDDSSYMTGVNLPISGGI
ncbi:SDR family NAD(P)-dependent oxidoreductase [Komagataeibacter swingsii]|uniref:SDR family oxidoreductase n=1 Tax=Komagataeibacter swingsii TaxID=215220 RepID=A0A850NZ29_9PROT|nr:SDR family oxidoreductase [Komagataeibacter swingsii]NVN35710.1 SDR family oxidoreductase [Komagataeibacter swingsii]RFP06965.1 oxidoreductase [Komagataeibacter xylinus]RFP07602.1 oxidoreductase [Komagataeibacter xylinus]